MTKNELSEKLLDTYLAKNKDYGNSAHRTYVEFGEAAYVIRISDKFSRIKRLLSSGERMVNDESVLDTIGDAITYLFMLCADLIEDDASADKDVRMGMTDNIDTTIKYLKSIPMENYSDYPRTPDFAEACLTRLSEVYHSSASLAARCAEYLTLAYKLVNEYLFRSEETK